MVLRDFEKGEEYEVTESMETMTPKRPKPLHNFTLPFLKWGNQRQLRCTNDAIRYTFGASSSVDRRSSKSNSNESTRTPNQPIVSRKRKRFVFGGGGNDHHHHHRDDEEGIAVVREKLMHDLKTATDRMKDAILREECEEETETLKSWNLRLRNKEIKAVPLTTTAIVKRDFCSPAKIDGGADNRVHVASRLRRNINSNKTERPKFSVQLSRKEIDEDFMAILGRQPRQRPTKRPKLVQKQLSVSSIFFPFCFNFTLTTARLLIL
jgi:hypothetical protein